MTDRIYKVMPLFIQNLMISIFNYLAYRKRYGGNYKYYRDLLLRRESLELKELLEIQKEKYDQFILYVLENSPFYKKIYTENKNEFPIVTKEQIRRNINNIYTINKNNGIISKTGGTTGKSLEVVFTHNDMQERFAMLDNFRSKYGYELGKKTAWFSGKALLTNRDIEQNRFWKTDVFYNVRLYVFKLMCTTLT